MSHRIENGVCTECGADERTVYSGSPCKSAEPEANPSGSAKAAQVGEDNQELVRRVREQCLQHLKYSERTYEIGVPHDALSERLSGLLAPSGFIPYEHLGRKEFWQLSDPEAGEFATVCAAFVERIGASKLKVSFGRFSFVQQVRSAATGLNLLAGGLILPAAGVGVGLLTVAVETTFWRRLEALLQELSPQYPLHIRDGAGRNAGTTLDRLEQLAKLKEAGALNDAEFADLKQQLLSPNAQGANSDAAESLRAPAAAENDLARLPSGYQGERQRRRAGSAQENLSRSPISSDPGARVPRLQATASDGKFRL